MSGIAFTKERLLKLYARINETGVPKVMTFLNADGTAHSISTYDFQFRVKHRSNSPDYLFTLSIGSGLTVQGASTNELLIEPTEANLTQEVDTNFWTLFSINENKTWLNGPFFFHDGEFDGVDEEDTITLGSGANVTISVTTEGSGTTGTGDVTGPALSVADEVVLFSGTTGKIIKSGGGVKDGTGGVTGLTLFKINFKNALNTFTSFFTNANTAARTYTFQDRDGTIADLTDVGSITTVSITTDTVLDSTAFGKIHVCTGTSANYTVTLPAASGNGGKSIAFKGDFLLTKLVTIDGSGTEKIDGLLTRTLEATRILVVTCDGTNWFITNSNAGTAVLYKNNSATGTMVIPSGSITGTVSATLIDSFLIKAGVIQANDILRITIFGAKTGTAGTLDVRLYAHTANQISGATNISTNQSSATLVYNKSLREIAFQNSVASEWMAGVIANPTDVFNTSTAGVTYTHDYSVDRYIIVAIVLGNTGDTGIIKNWRIELIRD